MNCWQRSFVTLANEAAGPKSSDLQMGSASLQWAPPVDAEVRRHNARPVCSDGSAGKPPCLSRKLSRRGVGELDLLRGTRAHAERCVCGRGYRVTSHLSQKPV